MSDDCNCGDTCDCDDGGQCTTPHYRRVKQFMVNAAQDTPNAPGMPDEKTRILRAKLIYEEVMETIGKGFGVKIHGGTSLVGPNGDATPMEFSINPDVEPDMVEAVDGCIDISVVTIGTLIALGVPDKPFLEAVDAANLAKFKNICPACRHEDEEPVHLDQNGHVRCTKCAFEYRSGYRRADGKWVKPENWTAPKIAEMLTKIKEKCCG